MLEWDGSYGYIPFATAPSLRVSTSSCLLFLYLFPANLRDATERDVCVSDFEIAAGNRVEGSGFAIRIALKSDGERDIQVSSCIKPEVHEPLGYNPKMESCCRCK